MENINKYFINHETYNGNGSTKAKYISYLKYLRHETSMYNHLLNLMSILLPVDKLHHLGECICRKAMGHKRLKVEG